MQFSDPNLASWCGVEMYTVPKREATIRPKNFRANIVTSFYESGNFNSISELRTNNLDQN